MRPIPSVLLTALLVGCAAPPTITHTPPATDTSQPATRTPAPTTTSAPTLAPTATRSPRLFGNRIMLAMSNGADDAWDADHAVPGTVIFADSGFYLFYTGWQGRSAGMDGVGLAESANGIDWARADAPLFTDLGIGEVIPPGLFSSSVLIENGEWVLYLWGAIPGEDHPLAQIYRATAADPRGEWTLNPAEPIVVAGTTTSWDSGAVLFPHVVRTEAGYLMWYDAWSLNDTEGIGMATSQDGIVWTKYDDPATTDALYAESDPVFSRDGHQGWDARTMRPNVLPTDSGFVMAYLGFQTNANQDAVGLAFSEDGIAWERCACNPVLTRQDVPAEGSIREFSFLHHEGAYHLFFEFGDDQSTDIWLSVFEGELEP